MNIPNIKNKKNMMCRSGGAQTANDNNNQPSISIVVCHSVTSRTNIYSSHCACVQMNYCCQFFGTEANSFVFLHL